MPFVAANLPLLSIRDAVFPAHPFSGLFAIGTERCWRLREIFPEFGFDAVGGYQADQRVNYLQARNSLLQAQHKGGADLAILSGSRKSIPQLGVMGSGMVAQANYREAIQFGLEYQLIAGSMLHLSLEINGETAAIVAHPLFDDCDLQDFLETDHLATVFNVSRALYASPLPLQHVELRSDLALYRSAYEDFFRCPVVFGADQSRLLFARRLLDVGLKPQDRSASLHSRLACESELRGIGVLGKQSLLHKLSEMQCENYSVHEAARLFGLSERSLHRLLTREGTSYFALAESRRIRRAKRMLTAGLSLDDIAEQLQYADARSFRRAFKRWTQHTPSAFRQHLKNRPP